MTSKITNSKNFTIKLIFLSFLIITSFIISSFNNISANAAETTCNSTSSSIIYKAGILKKQSINSDNLKLAAKGNNIKIYTDELNFLTKTLLLTGELTDDEAKEYELQYLIKREVLFNAAVKNGFLVNNNDITKYIQEQKDQISNAENHEDFTLYINAMNMTEDEYWKNQFESIKKDLTISDYLNSQKKELADKHNLTFYETYVESEIYENGQQTYSDFDKLEKLWTEYYQDLLNKLIDKENITVY